MVLIQGNRPSHGLIAGKWGQRNDCVQFFVFKAQLGHKMKHSCHLLRTVLESFRGCTSKEHALGRGSWSMSIGKQIQGVLSVRELDLPTEDDIFSKWVPFDILQSCCRDRISILVKAPSGGDDHTTFTQPCGSNSNNHAV